MTTLDAIDERIIRLLRADGRMSNARLAEAVGLSQSACLRRLHALEQSGVIRGYTAIVDLPDEGDVTVVYVHITLERQTEDYLDRFEAGIRRCHDVRECYLMTGIADYVLRVEAASVADYERIHREQLSRLPGIARIQSSFTIRSVVGSHAQLPPGRSR
ncbi:Lrp/AsnC family transcriptional regulator [Pseudoxanthobacter sp.]|uniref:Lrp/AsnC family transcriptional regulator n=1 Tax=Pseudoxanthobacter sp. TaxID=1925742 RepID=UPI002FE0AD89